jgi:hypothetical protein
MVLGVDREIVEEFLVLFRERYELADKANFFLEARGVSSINVTVANQRDALSHLVTVLRRPDLSRRQQLDQLASASEHLRRATLEPYAIAVAEYSLDVLAVREEYKSKVLPLIVRGRPPELARAPALDDVDKALRSIWAKRDRGRAAKARNAVDDEWELGVEQLILAFDEVDRLRTLMDEMVAAAEGITVRSGGDPQPAALATTSDDPKSSVWPIFWWIVALLMAFGLGCWVG